MKNISESQALKYLIEKIVRNLTDTLTTHDEILDELKSVESSIDSVKGDFSCTTEQDETINLIRLQSAQMRKDSLEIEYTPALDERLYNYRKYLAKLFQILLVSS